MQGDSKSFGRRILNTSNVLSLPINFISGYGWPFGESWILIFWRTKDSPSHPIFNDKYTGLWKFGFSEMLGLFEFKSQKQYLYITKSILDHAMKETTIYDKNQQRHIEELLLE